MKSAWITDQHFGVRSNSRVFLDNYEKFYSEVFFPTLEREGIDRVIGLGDFWEDRKQINIYTAKRAREIFLEQLKARGIAMYMIAGNHDTYFRDTNDVNGIDTLPDEFDNIIVFQKPVVLDLGVKVGLVPWVNKNNLEESVNWLSKTDAKVIGGHFEIKGFEMTKGQLAQHGFEGGMFSKFDAVYSGHFHVRSRQGNITYLSNPSQTSWGDLDLKKGFHIFDSEDCSMTPVDNPFDMFKQITWGKDEPVAEAFRGIYGRIRVPAGEVNRAALDLFVNEVNEIAEGIQVIEDTVEVNGVIMDAPKEDISTAALLDEYIDQVTSVREDVKADRLKAMIGELYAAAAAKMEVE